MLRSKAPEIRRMAHAGAKVGLFEIVSRAILYFVHDPKATAREKAQGDRARVLHTAARLLR